MKFTAVFCAVLTIAQANHCSNTYEKEGPYHDVWAVEKSCSLLKPCPRAPKPADGEWWLVAGSCLDSPKSPCGLERNQYPCACVAAVFKSKSFCEFPISYNLSIYSENTTSCYGSVVTNYDFTLEDCQSSLAIFRVTRKDTEYSKLVAALLTDNHQRFFVLSDCSSKAVYIFVKNGKTISAKNWIRIKCVLIENGIDPESLCEFNYSCCKSPAWIR